ncbi:hypothetical protein N9B79_01675, partial [bacterium]|nr:hypothetical protein [bacterium]
MNACQSLPAVIFLFVTVATPLNGTWVQAQDTTTTKDATSADTTVPSEQREAVTPNPFVPATKPPIDAGPTEPLPAHHEPAFSTGQEITSENVIKISEIPAEEMVIPEAEEVVMPINPPIVMSVPLAQPQVYFDAPAASQSDRRISTAKVAELRQQRALYRANQRRARMEYNL